MRAKKNLFIHCWHLTTSVSVIQSEDESKSKVEFNPDISFAQTGGGSLYLTQNLKYLREQRGLSQRDFSAALGLSCAAVGMWELERWDYP